MRDVSGIARVPLVNALTNRIRADGLPAGLRDLHRRARCCGSSARACRSGCSWSRRSRSASAACATRSSTRSPREPEHLPDAASLTAPLHRWRLAHLRPFLPALGRTLRRRPLGLARAAATTLAQALRDRRTPLSGPRKIYIKELLQAVALADRLLGAPDVAHLHAHFAHGTTTITWHAARIAGLPFSFTGHARDIYAEELNPRGWLRRKLLAAKFVVTCTEANRRHLRAIAPEASVHLVYHGLNADFARLVATDGDSATERNGTCACSASAAWWPRRASTSWSTRAPSCAAAASRSRR